MQAGLEGARVPADAMVGGADGKGTGFSIAMNGLNGGRINIAACSLGGAQSALDKSLAYMKERKAFGKRLDEFQALQLHGGYGYLSEYGIEKIVRDLRVHQILEGTNEIMRLIVSRKLIEGVR